MLKKSLLSLAVTASLVGLAGCNISSTTDNAGVTPDIQKQSQDAIENKVYPLFNPARSVLPVGIDLIFADAADSDGTANVGNDQDNPVLNALNDFDGISTLAPIDVQFNNPINPDTAVAGSTVFLIKLPNAASVGGAANLILPSVYDYGDLDDDGEPLGQVTTKAVDALDLASIAPFFAQTKADGSAPASTLETVAARNLFGSTFDGVDPGTISDGLIAVQPRPGVDYEVTVIGLDGQENNTIRINPLKPLDSATKYIALVTGSVEDTSGDKISESPDYQAISGNDKLVSSALEPVRSLVQSLETLGTQIITSGGTNLAPVADGIAFTSPFTTTDPDMVLKAMAYPGYWAPSVITNNTIADAIITAGNAINPFDAVTNTSGVPPAAAVPDVAKIPTAISVANGALTGPGFLQGGLTPYEHPRSRTFEIIPNIGGLGVDQLPVATLTQNAVTNDVLISQGAIELPIYTDAFNGADPSSFSDTWSANTLVGNVLDGALGQDMGTTPPSDIDGSKNVTYRYPFAQQKRYASVPVMMFDPTPAAGCSKADDNPGWPVVIMQHGFTSERTGNLINASNVAEGTCSVVIVMDLPHHGVAATSSRLVFGVDYVNTTNSALTPFAAAKKAVVDAATAAVEADSNSTALEDTILDSLSERHENFYGVNGVPTPMTFADDIADAEGDSGSLWIRLDSFQRTRDNSRQAVMDLLNLNASLAGINIDGDASNANGPDLDVSNVSYVGHSLGAIVGTAFVAVNNSSANTNLNPIQKAVLATPGGHLTKLIENSISFGPDVLNGLQLAAGISQGDSNLESFMKVFQATLDSADPMNFISDLSDGADADTPVLMLGIFGNGTTNLPDQAVPINGDGVEVSEGVFQLADGSIQPETARNPLTGLEPMARLLGAENVLDAPSGDKLLTKYNEGEHGTFSSAGNGTSGADSGRAFLEMVRQTSAFILTGAVPVGTDDDILISDAP